MRSRAVWAVVVLLVMIAATYFPFMSSSVYTCPYCRARLVARKVYGVPAFSQVSEGTFAQYWHKKVEPAHRHTWSREYGNDTYWWGPGTHRDFASHQLIRRLDDNLEIRVLECLPDNQARKDFVEQIVRADATASSHGEMFWRLNEILLLNDQNTNRTDWLRQLQRLGLFRPTKPTRQ